MNQVGLLDEYILRIGSDIKNQLLGLDISDHDVLHKVKNFGPELTRAVRL